MPGSIWWKSPPMPPPRFAKSWISASSNMSNKSANPKPARVKMRNVFKFLENGDKVKITMRFRGREMAHQNLGRDLLERVADDVTELGKVENMPKMEGRQMVMMIGPAK